MRSTWLQLRLFREGTFFLGGGGLGNFGIFFPKKVLALPCVLIKKTPDPPPLGD